MRMLCLISLLICGTSWAGPDDEARAVLNLVRIRQEAAAREAASKAVQQHAGYWFVRIIPNRDGSSSYWIVGPTGSPIQVFDSMGEAQREANKRNGTPPLAPRYTVPQWRSAPARGGRSC